MKKEGMDFSKKFCVFKRSDFTHYQENEASKRNFLRLSPSFQKKILESHQRQEDFVQKFLSFSKKLKMGIQFFSELEMNKIQVDQNSLVISCGGDGTFLSCAKHFPKSVLLGMNSDCTENSSLDGSLGALTSINIANLKEYLQNLAKGSNPIEEWPRLGVSINGKKWNRFAVNEVFIGNSVSYLTCDLTVEMEEMKDDFKCSGLLVCTGTGSSAWFEAAGGSRFSNELKAFGFLVLVPSSKWQPKFFSGVISNKKELKVRPHRDGYVLAFDSKPDPFILKAGDEVQFFLDSKNPIRVLKLHH